ncbi:cellulase-domain-containing protein [Gymnopus androsaceus JB14]|uniref:cellulase n=1 Tax=Gymnopus androsaceus JB14 TaxID=1447944 RepID=A0A6A4GYM4_9AGAR|nr:cellulase-domain-containing protein [Gymnopus androsaceus JB14]
MKTFSSTAFLLGGLAVVRAQVQLYGQCGGLEYNVTSTCVSGATCIYQNDFYWQCVSNAEASGATTVTPSTMLVPSSMASSSSATTSSVTVVATSSASITTVSTTASSALVIVGGQDWTTSTTCVSGQLVCTRMRVDYSQCLPESEATSVFTSGSTTASSTGTGTPLSSASPSSTSVSSTSLASTSTSVASPSTSASSASTSSTSASTTSVSKTSPSSTSVSSTSTSSTSAAASSAISTSSSSSLSFRGGVNTAGYDFSVETDGSFSGTGVTPPVSQYAHFADEGVNVFRIPFAWQLMTPTLGGTIDSTFFAEYDATVQAALASGDDVYVIVDLHNYARWNGGIIGQGGPTNDEFANIWSQLATEYADNDRIILGLMNEPHDLTSLSDWANSVQAAVTAIRSAGATSQYILLPGSSYSSAGMLPTEAGPYLLDVTDPSGGTDKLLFDVHQYLDSDGSGTSTTCVTDNVGVLTTLVSWLQTNNRQAFLSETGGGSTSSCESYLDTELAFVKANSDYIVGFTAWAAGAFDTLYALSVTPNSDGTDQPIFTEAILPNLP